MPSQELTLKEIIIKFLSNSKIDVLVNKNGLFFFCKADYNLQGLLEALQPEKCVITMEYDYKTQGIIFNIHTKS